MSYHGQRDCCDGLRIDFTKMEIERLYVDFSDVNLWYSIATIFFNPFFWNVMARLEYKKKLLSKIFKSPHIGCWFLAASIFLLGVFRDLRYQTMLSSQPQWPLLQDNWALMLGYSCMAVGLLFVLSSYWALGFYGTFLGDYFGILMDNKVTGFPFSVLENPMYWGSSLIFFGSAITKSSQAGILVTCIVVVCYKIALSFEGPFTNYIYAERERMLMKSA